MGAPKSVKDWMELARSMGADALGIASDPEAVVTLLRMRLGCQDRQHEDGRPMLAVEAASAEHRGSNLVGPFPASCDQAHADVVRWLERATEDALVLDVEQWPDSAGKDKP